MKVHSNEFKNIIKKNGRQLDSKITFGNTVLGKNDLNAVTPSFQGGILKSVMKQLDIDSNVPILVGTILNYQFGVKVNGEYEYLDFGNYVVKDVEKQEDTMSYKITCYDKMLFSMREYIKLPIVYPISVRDYINSLCIALGITFKNRDEIFANYDKMIQNELYLDGNGNSLGYTFRDVFDELAQVTASTICINENDELEIRYINETNDIIDEEFLKDVNVNFGEKYGPINSIVLSRSAESDNIYLNDEESILQNGLTEIKIKDNQIMNFNDRDNYLPDIFGKLSGLEYYLNDYSSTGITYYDLCDKYTVKVNEEMYSCIMFNNEVNVTQGLEEFVYTELSEETKTDYTKADKTDRKINQTYLIVDKQNQQIESVISRTDEQNEKIARVTQTVEELNSKISDIADITTSAEDTDAKIEISEVNQSEPIRLVIRPIGENISYLYPSDALYPSDDLFMKIRTIRFHNKTTNEDFDYELPDDLLYYDSENYDEFILDYDGQSCVINKKVGYNADGTTYVLDTPKTVDYPYPRIILSDGDYDVYILSYDRGYIFARLMAKNIYTTQFYTKAETDSIISQTSQSIDLSVNQKLSNYSTTAQMNSAIQLSATNITSSVSQTYSTKTELGNTTNQLNSKIEQTATSITSSVSQTTNALSSRIKQTAKTIELTTSDNNTSAGITIKLKNEDGTQIDSKSANITLSGLVKFTDLSGSGTTTINGSNITTGTISADRLASNVITTSNLSAQAISAYQITSGTLSADRISGGTINANNINVANLNAGNITRGSINNIPYNFNSGSTTGLLKLGGDDAPIMGYYGVSPRWSIAAFTNGGRFQTFNGSGVMAAYFDHNGAHTTSDIRFKKHIENIDKEKSLNIITNLNPITYDYNDNDFQRGLSAQEVEKVLNENGYYDQIYKIENDKYTLNYTQLIPDLINCIKYLNDEIKKLKESDK